MKLTGTVARCFEQGSGGGFVIDVLLPKEEIRNIDGRHKTGQGCVRFYAEESAELGAEVTIDIDDDVAADPMDDGAKLAFRTSAPEPDEAPEPRPAS